MDGDGNLVGVERHEWERIIRRVRMSSSAKHIGHVCAGYGNPDGTSIYPGAEKLAAVTGYTEKTVRTGLKILRDLGLLERVREGRRAGRAALADEYRLTRPLDLIDRVHLLDVRESPETITCDQGCQHKGSPVISTGDQAGSPVTTTGDDLLYGVEHRYSVPGTPVMSSRTPVMSSPITGNEDPPPVHDQATYQPKDQPSDHLENSSTESADDLLAKLIEIDRQAGIR